MPAAASTAHRLITDMAIPYVTFDSPIASRPAFEKGRNLLTSERRVLERRPGFSAQPETAPTTIPGTINNIHIWRRWNGSFFIMLSVAHQGNSEVWKLEIGKDASFTALYIYGGTTAPFSFITRNNHCMFGNGFQDSMRTYDGTKLRTWGILAPEAPTCTIVDLGALNAITSSTDYHYRLTYWDADEGHESSPSEVNQCLGQFTDKAVHIVGKASTNPRVTHIRIYRTRDGGSINPRQMQEINASPIANTDFGIDDWTEDADLRDRFAPQLFANDPPPPLTGFVSHGSRIFGHSGHKIFFSAFDENTNGVQEECFPGGDSGNWYPFDDEIQSMAKLAGDASGVVVFEAGTIYKIDGELRNEIRRYALDEYHGLTGGDRAAVGFASEAVWFDVSQQVRLSSVGELSMDIRPDMEQIDSKGVFIVPHISHQRNWVCVLDSMRGFLYVFDTDTHIWQVPWTVNATAIASGQIAPNKRALVAAIDGQIWYMVEGTYNDAGAPYPAWGYSNLIPVAPDVNPDLIQGLDSISIERNTKPVADIKISLDELATVPDQYVSLKANEGDPTLRKTGKSLVERRYTIPNEMGMARRISLYLEWPIEDANFEVYSVNTEIHTVEGR